MYAEKGRRWKDPEQEEMQKKFEAEKKRIEEGDEDQELKRPELTAEEKAAQRKVDNESLKEFKEDHMRWDESTWCSNPNYHLYHSFISHKKISRKATLK